MKKHVFLTSLVAISMSCAAHAASDVNFAGEYTNNSGATVKVADGITATTYEYQASDGSTVSGIAYNAEPDLTKFTYEDATGASKDLSTAVLTQADYVGTSAADNTIVTTTQAIAAGAKADRANYSYVDGYGNTVALGTAAQDIVTSHTLNSEFTGDKEIAITNGAAEGGITAPNGTDYSFESAGVTYTLNEDGTALMQGELDVTASIPGGSALETKFNEAKAAYTADASALTTAIADNATKTSTETTNFGKADTAFTTDSATISTLDTRYATIATAESLLATANANKQTATDNYNASDALFQAAKDVYNAPIETTIENGASAVVDTELASGGKISDAIKVESDRATAAESVLDGKIADNSTAISDEATRATAAEGVLDGKISANTTAIEANAANITANTTAIADEVARATAAEAVLDGKIADNTTAISNETSRATAAEAVLDGKIAANTTAIADEINNRIAGDELTLNAAKAYADSQGALNLQKANEYTDSKVNTLEKELSAGIASAAAMSSVAVSGVSKGEVSVGGGYGYYNSQSAVAFGAAMGLTDNWSVNAAAGLADSNVTFRAGTNYKFKLF